MSEYPKDHHNLRLPQALAALVFTAALALQLWILRQTILYLPGSAAAAANSAAQPLSPELGAIALFCLRGFLLLITYFVAASCIFTRRPTAAGLISGVAIAAVPLVNDLGVSPHLEWLIPSWQGLAAFGALILLLVGMLSLAALLYIFPDGRFTPRWMRIPAAVLFCFIPAGFAAGMLEEKAPLDELLLPACAAVLLLGAAGQVLRVVRMVRARRYNPTGWALLCLAAGVVWPLLASKGDFTEAMAQPIGLFETISAAIFSLFPLVIGRLTRPWGEAPAAGPKESDRMLQMRHVAVIGLLCLIIGGTMGIDAQRRQARYRAALAETGAQPVMPVIFDTDMASDDILALLYLLQLPQVELRAITVTGTGEVHCEPGVLHVLQLLDLTGAPDIPVSCGSEQPLAGNHAFPSSWREAVDDFYGLELPPTARQPSPLPAPQLLAETIAAEEGKVTVLAVGPLTNLAEMFDADPTLASKIQSLVIMSGAVHVPGNVGASSRTIDNPYADWNFYADPQAASMVFHSQARITLVPLDATNYAPVTEDFFSRLASNHPTPAAALAFELLLKRYSVITRGGYYFWDTLTTVVMLHPEVARFTKMRLEVTVAEGPESGRTQITHSANSPRVTVAVWADRRLFETLFLKALTQGK